MVAKAASRGQAEEDEEEEEEEHEGRRSSSLQRGKFPSSLGDEATKSAAVGGSGTAATTEAEASGKTVARLNERNCEDLSEVAGWKARCERRRSAARAGRS